MEEAGFLQQAVIYLSAAVIAVPIATRLGLGSVLGYLLAGVAIGPYVLGLVGDASEEMHMAEFGVALMLFLIGLELQPKKLWKMRGAILGTGSAQVLLTAAAVSLLALLLFGKDWRSAVAIGLILALSSTAIVLQSLSEKGLLKTEGGRGAFGVLLFQDIAVIPILALLPLLSGNPPEEDHTGLSGWSYGLALAGTVIAFAAAGRYLLGPLLRLVAGSDLREMFTVTSLLIVLAAAATMHWLELSPALGTFLAGVLLAESEFRHELEADIQPFKGLLLGLFFIAVGANLNFNLIIQHPLLLLGLVLLLVGVKFAVLHLLGRMVGMSRGEDWLFSLSLAQAGEFGFVLVSFAVGQQVLDNTTANLLLAVIALSMALTPVLLLIYEEVIRPRYLRGASETPREEEVPLESDSPVIIIGYGRFGQITGRLLNACGFGTTLLERSAEQLDLVRRYGIKAYYGDASRQDLLRAAGADNAKLVILTLSDQAACLEIVAQIQKHFPHLTILARARNRMHQYALMEAGVKYIFRETVDSALSIGECALQLLGFNKFRAARAARKFKQHDQRMLEKLFPYWRDESQHIAQTKIYREQLLQALREDRRDKDLHLDHHWDENQPKPSL
ncbi:monovalent cation:proton antiporter-2 (CPA2) family protein [Microbulbifer thermotolerans]|uniref:Monovalent cation:proton antiporter-2 (CPA2) family protein n=1 Tax=Microbulbifer thermotolerans TaxID=252514 RepID=A0A143HQ87_MICTH|nr:monovalent cation:proton antiporter-2 (CPA2) family protein [Microbulbifer thermotolerans]AMX03905.1 potassium transporter [Microbulbifer thermotolerans]MCX2778572.1 monovalent cation:proton antiporter-2 (CPA2) family protein [Microbulbifer thermotolerans]MCX2782881.1 monovalent cation:proton antiporter-2 (CPA2) family protein [Microbulbifer thermotolerans]MCX2794048.1 monovalent cation:proton antiporter-2 (CPA2) family protein [Microbulbifer thermotolerans]MCX2801757.1 monovalent cation:pr